MATSAESSSIELKVDLSQSEKEGLTTVELRMLDQTHVSSIYPLFQDRTQAGFGMGLGEFPTEEIFEKKIFKNSHVFGFFHKEKQEMLAMFNISPAIPCRSLKPLLHAGFIVVANPQMKGLGKYLVVLYSHFAYALGYSGTIGRNNINNAGTVGIINSNSEVYVLGTIPHSVRMQKVGWTGDLMTFADYNLGLNTGKTIHEIANNRVPPELPELKPAFQSPADTWDKDFSLQEISLPNDTMLKVATDEQRNSLETWMHEKAEQGELFGVDEFTEEGFFGRKPFQKSKTLALVDDAGVTRGWLLVGSSNYCRDVDAPVLHAYAFSKDGNSEEEKALYTAALDIARSIDFIGVLTDVFKMDQRRNALLVDMEFRTNAVIPYSAYVKNKGYMENFLMYKRLSQHGRKQTKGVHWDILKQMPENACEVLKLKTKPL